MRPGRELDTKIAEDIFGHTVLVKQKVLHERTPGGDRPLRNYSKEIQWAWEVAKKMNITMIPIEGGTWFAMAGKENGWGSPGEFIAYLTTGNFVDSGAAVGDDAPLMICLAALKALESRKVQKVNLSSSESAPSQTH